jgi:hypothetical protein
MFYSIENKIWQKDVINFKNPIPGVSVDRRKLSRITNRVWIRLSSIQLAFSFGTSFTSISYLIMYLILPSNVYCKISRLAQMTKECQNKFQILDMKRERWQWQARRLWIGWEV